MMLFTTDDINELLGSIDVFHDVFLAEHIGPEVLSRADKRLMRKFGYDPAKFKAKTDALTYAFHFGKLESSVRDKGKLKKLTLSSYKDFVRENPDKLTLSRADKYALAHVKQRAYHDVKKLAAEMKNDYATALIESSKTSRLYLERMLRAKAKGKEVAPYLMERIKGTLRKQAKKYTHRFGLIASYTMHSAYHHGIMVDILERKGPNVRVYYSVQPDACDHCVRVYLRRGIHSEPKVLYLKNIIGYGSNIGRSPKDYRPSIDPIHPNCRCRMNLMPDGKVRWDVDSLQYTPILRKKRAS